MIDNLKVSYTEKGLFYTVSTETGENDNLPYNIADLFEDILIHSAANDNIVIGELISRFNYRKLEDGYYVAIAPNKRYKQGKAIASALLSYKSVTNYFKVMQELNIEDPQARHFSITQLLRSKDRIFVYFDDSIRAEKHNPDFKEITMGEYEDFINGKN